MNTHRFLVLPVLLASALACQTLAPPLAPPTPGLTPTPTARLLHFENEWVAFDYPADLTAFEAGFDDPIWYPTVDFGAELVVGLGDERFFGFENYYRSIRVLRRELPASADLAGIMQEVYAQPGVEHPWPLVEGGLELSQPSAVAGQNAVYKCYRIYSGEPAYDLCDVWIPKGSSLYIINAATEWTNPDDVAQFEQRVEDLLGGLVIK